jgi:hypothetical protein
MSSQPGPLGALASRRPANQLFSVPALERKAKLAGRRDASAPRENKDGYAPAPSARFFASFATIPTIPMSPMDLPMESSRPKTP